MRLKDFLTSILAGWKYVWLSPIAKVLQWNINVKTPVEMVWREYRYDLELTPKSHRDPWLMILWKQCYLKGSPPKPSLGEGPIPTRLGPQLGQLGLGGLLCLWNRPWSAGLKGGLLFLSGHWSQYQSPHLWEERMDRVYPDPDLHPGAHLHPCVSFKHSFDGIFGSTCLMNSLQATRITRCSLNQGAHSWGN